MRCGRCNYEMLVDHAWMDRWERGRELCPACGIDCTVEDRARPTYEPEDLVLHDENVASVYWYHTSTIADWPQHDFDPAAGLTQETIEQMTRSLLQGGFDRWVARQKSKALHVGTYEAAIENMFRRMANQPQGNKQFYLFRVELEPEARIELGVHREPTNWVGDAHPEEFLSSGNQVYRYINEHEDPGGISLALTRDAIKAVTGIPVPLRNVPRADTLSEAGIESLDKFIMASGIPARLQERLERAIRRWGHDNEDAVTRGFVKAVLELILNPELVLERLDEIAPRAL